jgi:tryptophan-rich sensory protein
MDRRFRIQVVMGRLGGKGKKNLGTNLAVFVGAPLVLNGIIFALGWNRPRAKAAGIPPGWVVGSLWLLLFAGMGAARWQLESASTSLFRDRRAEWVSLLAFLCLTYPLYTEGLRDDRIGLGGNIVTALVSFAAVERVAHRSQTAALLLLPTCLWLSYAAYATARAVRNGRF